MNQEALSSSTFGFGGSLQRKHGLAVDIRIADDYHRIVELIRHAFGEEASKSWLHLAIECPREASLPASPAGQS